ncbi:hypothetical protein TNIN_180091 [Trichonephila inaurata madagascariensis]|uniref:Uncharacterized protein n=1 Tax=Trichonephila inaurata madagascariensis TaxID=2747483 RepID=A0A8X6JJ44_9ARAC|nr:hypothetical protein TNIN_237401 [Trichonephila inaurata madagascariensis]GFY48837.1 hypothetical protein TNIN_180091 [Trichonephila inaurata madagascariensis]
MDKTRRTLECFVRNRVRSANCETSMTGDMFWGIKSRDLPSRDALLKSKWWEGPMWLLLREKMWPETSHPIKEAIISIEK